MRGRRSEKGVALRSGCRREMWVIAAFFARGAVGVLAAHVGGFSSYCKRLDGFEKPATSSCAPYRLAHPESSRMARHFCHRCRPDTRVSDQPVRWLPVGYRTPSMCNSHRHSETARLCETGTDST